MITKDDPLKNLYVDKDEVDRLRLFHSIKDYVGIDRGTGDPVYLEKFYELDEEKKLIIYLLYRRAAAALGELDYVGISLRDISRELKMEYDQVKKKVDDIDCIKREKSKGKYYIPSDNLEEAIANIGHKEGGSPLLDIRTDKI